MAIAAGNTSSVNVAADNPSWSHTVAAGSNRALYVFTPKWKSGGALVTGVTYGGVALTRVASSSASAGDDRAEIWRLLNPTAGAATVAASVIAPTGTFGGLDLNGVHQTTPEGTPNSATGNSTTPSVNVTSATGELVLDCMASDGSATTTNTIPGEQTTVFNVEAGDERCHASYEAGAATTTMSSTLNGTGGNWAICAIPVKPAAAAQDTPELYGRPYGDRGGNQMSQLLAQ